MGPKKKGGKANKLARMTDEQRERYLQHRAAIEEETRRRKEQLIATFMRNKLKREEAFTRINSAKINQHWRQILRKIKCAELREDVESLWQGFDRVMDQKGKQKNELLSSLTVAERQYSDTLQSHLDVVDRLLSVHLEHVSHLQALFKAHVDELLHSATEEKANINVTFEKENYKLQVIRTATELKYNSTERQDAKYEYINSLSFLKRKNTEDREKFAAIQEYKLHDIWLEIQTLLQSYETNTAAKRRTVLQLNTVEQNWLKTLARIHQSSRKVNQIRDDTENKINEMTERSRKLKKEKDSMTNCHKKMVERMEKEKKKDEDKFQHLVVSSEQALKKLEAVKAKGEKAIGLMVLCHRLKTETERSESTLNSEKEHKLTDDSVDPKSSILTESHQTEQTESDSEDPDTDLEKKELKVFSKLQNFWKRYNKAYLEVSQARMERDMLLLDNQKLRSTLRSYLFDMARVDSCGAPTGHRVAIDRPHTSKPPRFSANVNIQRPFSSLTVRRNIRDLEVGSKPSIARSSESIKKVAHGCLSTYSSNSDQWSV